MSFGIVATVAVGAYAANRQAKAAKQAGQMGADAANRASQVEWDMYEQSRQDAEPWRQAGLAGLQEYLNLLGLPSTGVMSAITASQSSQPKWDPARAYLEANPDVARNEKWVNDPWGHYLRYGISEGRKWQDTDPNAPASPVASPQTGSVQTPQQAQQAAFDRFRATPGYQFNLTEGARALDASASARGGLFSGKAGLDMTRYGQNYADRTYNDYMNRLGQLSGVGQTQTNTNAQYGQQVAQSAGQNLMAGANARASGLIGATNAWSNFGQQAVGAFGQWYGNRPKGG